MEVIILLLYDMGSVHSGLVLDICELGKMECICQTSTVMGFLVV